MTMYFAIAVNHRLELKEIESNADVSKELPPPPKKITTKNKKKGNLTCHYWSEYSLTRDQEIWENSVRIKRHSIDHL